MGVVIFSFFALLTISLKCCLLSSPTGFLWHLHVTHMNSIFIYRPTLVPKHICLSKKGHAGWSVPPRPRGDIRSLEGEAPTLLLSALAEFWVVWWQGDRSRDPEDQVLAPQATYHVNPGLCVLICGWGGLASGVSPGGSPAGRALGLLPPFNQHLCSDQCYTLGCYPRYTWEH